jgi:hypothetical protein
LIEHIGDEIDALDDKERENAADDWAKEVGRVQLAATVRYFFATRIFWYSSLMESSRCVLGIAAGADTAFTAYFIYRKRGIRWKHSIQKQCFVRPCRSHRQGVET